MFTQNISPSRITAPRIKPRPGSPAAVGRGGTVHTPGIVVSRRRRKILLGGEERGEAAVNSDTRTGGETLLGKLRLPRSVSICNVVSLAGLITANLFLS